MGKQCKHCGAELPEDASFCPHCAQSQNERSDMRPPRLWRKKLMCVILALLLLTAAALAVFLSHKPKVFEGGASVTYTDRDGTYQLLVTSSSDDILLRRPEEKKTISFPVDETLCLPAMVGVWHNGELADPLAFLAKVDKCTMEAFPNENGALTLGLPAYNKIYLYSVLEADVWFTGNSGTNELVWTLTMKNGDIIRLRETFEVLPLVHQTYTAEDAPLDTTEDLYALLARINGEVPRDRVVDIYLPPVTYTGDLKITSRAVNLYGCSDGTGRTALEGTLTVGAHDPAGVTFENLDFVGSGGIGLSASASTKIRNCSFTGYDIGAAAKDGGMICVTSCTFRNNRIGFSYNTAAYSIFSDEFSDCVFADNDVGIQFICLPGITPLDFRGTVFSGNRIDIDNPMGYPLELSNAIFKES